MIDLPSTAKVIFPRMAKSSKIEGEGGRHIPERILWSLAINCSWSLPEPYNINL